MALRLFGYRDDQVELLPDPDDRDLLARVRLVEEEALFAAIPRRRTTRAAFEERPVAADLQRELEEDAAREGAWLQPLGAEERDGRRSG